MSPANSIEMLLEDIKENPEIKNVTLVSRSGMHIAGEVPKNSHRETFVAMSAILLGSAETATSELKDELSYVLVELKNSRILILNSGPSAILVTRLNRECDIDETINYLEDPIQDIQDSL
ncbi:MAG: roadblock/LC7 domain-containing protein [Thermoplasmatota archaeon]